MHATIDPTTPCPQTIKADTQLKQGIIINHLISFPNNKYCLLSLSFFINISMTREATIGNLTALNTNGEIKLQLSTFEVNIIISEIISIEK